MSERPATTVPIGTEVTAKVHPWTALLLRAQAGSAEAFATLVEEAEKPIFGFVHRKVRDGHITEDILAETFMKAWRTLPAYQPERCQANTWLFMIARRLVIDHLRKKGRRGETLLGETERADLIDPRKDTPEKRAEQEHRAAVVRKALERLPERYAEALDLMYLQEMDRHEVATVLGCSVNAASSLLTRARDRLKEELNPGEL